MQAFVLVRSRKTCIGVVQKCPLDPLVGLWVEGVCKFSSNTRVKFSFLTVPRVLELSYKIFLYFSGFIKLFRSKQGFKKKDMC